MSHLLEIKTQLEAVRQRVLSIQQSLREYPEYPSIAANLESAIRIQRSLEEALDRESMLNGNGQESAQAAQREVR